MKRQQPIRPCSKGRDEVGPAMSDPPAKNGGMEYELPLPATAPAKPATGSTQLDLSLPTAGRRTARRQRPCSRERAAWWFAQMRRVVEEGREVRATGGW